MISIKNNPTGDGYPMTVIRIEDDYWDDEWEI